MLKATAEDIMSENVVTISGDATIQEAAHILLRFQINGLLVMGKKSRVVGILTTTDLLRLLDRGLSQKKKRSRELERIGDVKVTDIASRDIVRVQKKTKIVKVAALMHRKNVHTIPVYSKSKLVGILGRHDILNAAFYRDNF